MLDNGNRQDKLHYACRITQKAYDQGLKVFVQSDDRNVSQQMDSLLWTFSRESFIPHCIRDTPERSWEDYPVQLGSLQTGNSGHGEGQFDEFCADVVVNLADTPSDVIFGFPRIVDLVSGEQTDRIAGRERFRMYREKGLQPNTHKLDQK